MTRFTSPLILTLELAAPDQERFDALRRRHFPPNRNHLRAHVTLFHKLPGQELDLVLDDVGTVAQRAEFEIAVQDVRLLGRGVAFGLASPALTGLRAELAARWDQWLSPQDRQRFRPHVTVQNKVDPDDARALHERLSATFVPYAVTATGLTVWTYQGGPWFQEQSVAFTPRGSTSPVLA